MYTHHEDHDIFVCDICEAIMVTEEAIGDHLKMKHREEIRRTSVKIIPDSERDVKNQSEDVNEDEVQMEEVLENPKFDLNYVNKQFYVCQSQKCDEIFLDRRHLQVHMKLSHVVDADGPMKDAPGPEDDPPCPTCPTPKKNKVNNENSYRTVRQGPSNAQSHMSTKSPIRLLNSPLKENNVNLVNSKKNAEAKGKNTKETLLNKLSDSNGEPIEIYSVSKGVDSPPKVKRSPQIKKDSEFKGASKKNFKNKSKEKNKNNKSKILEKRNLLYVLTKESAIKSKKNKPTSVKSSSVSPQKTVPKEYQCSTCGKINAGAGMFKNHFLSHHYDKFATVLPNVAPYNCPVCPASDIRDKITLIRHYAFTHKKLSKALNITEEKLKEIVQLSVVPRDQ